MCLHPRLLVQVTGIVSEEQTPLQAADLAGPKAGQHLMTGVCVCTRLCTCMQCTTKANREMCSRLPSQCFI